MKYQPANGTEGMIFMARFCDVCERNRVARDSDYNDGECPILIRTTCYTVGDLDYPDEWQYVDGKPICTAFENEKENDEPLPYRPTVEDGQPELPLMEE
jgi:hypothetical protein